MTVHRVFGAALSISTVQSGVFTCQHAVFLAKLHVFIVHCTPIFYAARHHCMPCVALQARTLTYMLLCYMKGPHIT